MGVLVNNEVLWTGYLDAGHEYIETNISYDEESPVKVYKDGVPQILDSDYNLEEYNGNFKVNFPGGFDQQALISIVNDFDHDKLPSWENKQINDKRYLNQMINSLKILFQESKESSELTFKLIGPIKHLSDFLAFYDSDLFKDLNSLLEAVNEWYLEVSKWNDEFQGWADEFYSSIEEQLEDLIEYLETLDVGHMEGRVDDLETDVGDIKIDVDDLETDVGDLQENQPVYEEYAESDFGHFKVNGVSKLLGGEVVETGEEYNGKYIKYANGLMLCSLWFGNSVSIPYNQPITRSDLSGANVPFEQGFDPHSDCLRWMFPGIFDEVLFVSANSYGISGTDPMQRNHVTVENRYISPTEYVFYAKNAGNELSDSSISDPVYFHLVALGTWS